MVALLAALLSGAMFYLSQGLDNVWALAWFAPTPLLWLAYRETPWWQFLLASLGAYLAGNIYVVQCYAMLNPIIVLSVVGPLTALFGVSIGFARFAQRHARPIVALFAFPLCFTACEFLFSLVSPNGTYGSLAYSQMPVPLLIQSASLFGMYAVTFLICLFANLLAIVLSQPAGWLPALAVGSSICVLNVAFGTVRLSQPADQAVRVSAFVRETAHPGHGRVVAIARAEAYASAIRRAAAHGAALAVTPEGGLPTRPEWESAVLAPLKAASHDTGITIIAGVYIPSPAADIALTIQPDGSTRTYAKRHMVPMLETFVPGTVSGWLGNGRAVEICKDMDFPRTIRSDAAMGVKLMAVPAGDFGKDAWLHARMAIMRGVENGFALVRAANEGLLTASDAKGRLVASKMSAQDGMTVIVADLPLGPGPTLYSRSGDMFAWLCVFAVFVLGGHMLVARKPNKV